MKYRLKIIDREDVDFRELKENGFGGVIFTDRFLTGENLKSAKKRRLKTFFHIRDLSSDTCFYLDSGGVYEENLYRVTLETVKTVKERLGDTLDMLDGLVVSIPYLKGLLWDEEFPLLYEDFCGRDIKEDLPAVFDKDTENPDFRVWYYSVAAQMLFFRYILPLSEYLETIGKKVCFDFGSMNRCIDLVKKQINPFLLQKHKISVIYETKDGIILVGGKEKYKQNLLVLPMRSIMLNFAYGANYSRQESPLVLALAEEEYYKSTLKRCKIEYSVVSEFEFSCMKQTELKKFENILVCDSCVFSDNNRIEMLKKSGHKINDKEILDILDRAN
ncbi:MAG: hypothetical protein K5768_09395 [Firmicutes bacterium]|nr:hypothetical protein [Bacillota bacterium]